MEDSGDAQIAAQTMASEFQQSLSGAVEKQRVEARRIEQDQRVQFLGECENTVVVRDGEQTGQLLLEPVTAFGGQAAGTMTIATGTGSEVPFVASGALIDVGAQGGGAAGGQEAEHPEWAGAEPEQAGRGGQESAQHLSQSQRVCGHFPVLRQRAEPVHRAEKWALADLGLALRSQSLELDQVQGRTDFTQARGGDVEITGGGQQAGMAEQTLDER
jgi:hypothetical protein